MSEDVIVGIDLGTTNSEVAAWVDDRVKVLGRGSKMLASCVGLTAGGELLVGEAARNQQRLYPERTVRSIKRKMGSSETVNLGDRAFTPPQISALILRELVDWARNDLAQPVTRAVITVPAYFSDAQRTATREAGTLAGLEVVRILNEPTAASLAYGFGDGKRRRVLVYDLGGGTFDVSVVSVEDEVTEVLASHGNNRLGGDDFNDLLVEHFAREFERRHGVHPRQGGAATMNRLWWAAEEAKKKLSSEQYVHVLEDSLVTLDRRPLHLDVELSRETYEDLIRQLVSSTLGSVEKAMSDARLRASDLDEVVLVGGSTRTPLVAQMLEEMCRIRPRQDVHPDLCVALGAGVLASRLGGHATDRVLVDVSPYSFGISHLGQRLGEIYPYCYRPLITRNTPLPVTRTERYSTSIPHQTTVQINVFQGEKDDALENVPIGEFKVEGLRDLPTLNELLCKMTLDLDGILHVTAIEKETGHSARIRIDGAVRTPDNDETELMRNQLERLFAGKVSWLDLGRQASDDADEDELWENEDEEAGPADAGAGGAQFTRHDWNCGVVRPDEVRLNPVARGEFGVKELALLERSKGLLDSMHAEDREEALALHLRIQGAIDARDANALADARALLEDLLFYVEGR